MLNTDHAVFRFAAMNRQLHNGRMLFAFPGSLAQQTLLRYIEQHKQFAMKLALAHAPIRGGASFPGSSATGFTAQQIIHDMSHCT